MLAVTAQASDVALLTVAEARTAIGDATVAEGRITTLIARVSAVITRECKVATGGMVPPTLRLESLTDTYRLKSTQDVLILSRRFVVEIVSVVEAGTTLDVATDYEFDAESGLLYRLSGDARTCWSSGKIVVTYRAGFETVPDDLKEAASKLARVLWSEGVKTDPGLKRENIPGVIEKEWWVGPSDDPLIPQEIKDALVPYMNHWVG